MLTNLHIDPPKIFDCLSSLLGIISNIGLIISSSFRKTQPNAIANRATDARDIIGFGPHL